jgi:hypothetical protein
LHAILNVAVFMGIRFEKVLEQIARAGNAKSDASALQVRERKVQRLEELIRAREAVGDRIVMCLGLVLVLSAIGLPVYALHFSDGYSYLRTAASGTSTARTSTGNHPRSVDLNPPTTGSLSRPQNDPDLALGNKGATVQGTDRKTQFQRYVIHRATGESALIEGPEGLWWVTPGMTLPGIGQIISIEQSDSGWVVLTSETTITQPPMVRASN